MTTAERLRYFTGTLRLVDSRTRVVEVLGPEPPGSRRPTDRELLFERPGLLAKPEPVGLCIEASDRRAKFLVDEGVAGDEVLEMLSRHPDNPYRLVRPYTVKGWLLEGA